MNIEKLIDKKKAQLKKRQYIEFSDAEIAALNTSLIKKLIARMDGGCLMKLPPSEAAFFDWLRGEEPEVWNDLWGEEDDEYLISVHFLEQILNKTCGFPICDLHKEDNYWFCSEHLKPKAKDLIPQIMNKVKNKQKLKLHEAFLAAINSSPIDIWHFAYHHNIKIKTMKLLISELDYQGLIVHLQARQDLERYLEEQ